MWQPNTMQVWVTVWGILDVGICFSFFREEGGWLEIKLRRNSKLLLSCPGTQRSKVVAKLNPQTFNEYLSLLVCQPSWHLPHNVRFDFHTIYFLKANDMKYHHISTTVLFKTISSWLIERLLSQESWRTTAAKTMQKTTRVLKSQQVFLQSSCIWVCSVAEFARKFCFYDIALVIAQ